VIISMARSSSTIAARSAAAESWTAEPGGAVIALLLSKRADEGKRMQLVPLKNVTSALKDHSDAPANRQ
jgi:hypothetical protein